MTTIPHYSFCDALQAVFLIEAKDEAHAKRIVGDMLLPSGWSLSVAAPNVLIFDVEHINVWESLGVHMALVAAGVRFMDQLESLFAIEALVDKVRTAYNNATNILLDRKMQNTWWGELIPLVEHVRTSGIADYAPWQDLHAIVDAVDHRQARKTIRKQSVKSA